MSLAVEKPHDIEIIRISNIAGRYLVFDHDAVARLRRCEHTNGTLFGTTPQQPTQNVFLGLPVELRPEEVHALLHRNSAYVVDNVIAHNTVLRSNRRAATRRSYVTSLRNSKHAAEYTWIKKSVLEAGSVARHEGSFEDAKILCLGRNGVKHFISAQDKAVQCDNQTMNARHVAVTPVSSATLIASVDAPQAARTAAKHTLCDFLQSWGHYMTAGLRFGAKYSVYPGDPLRFHAHFMANEYSWEEEIPVLDLVGGGRLATAVKKAFLIGGHNATKNSDKGLIRTCSIEWAAM